MTATTVWPGTPYPLGATWDGEGVNFALSSERATAVDLCLFDGPDAPQETVRIPFTEQTDNVWHAYVPGLKPGQLYAYRVHGPHDPEAGLRFNPHKLLLDPYAKAISGEIRWDDAVYGYTIGDENADLSQDLRDSAPFMPRCVVIDPAFDWGTDRAPNTPLHDSIIYELHVKGFTERHPAIPEALRGTYAGLAYPPVIRYLQALGITAVELLPIHQFVQDRHLVEQGLRNYWGYNSLGFLAPHGDYSSAGDTGDQVREFKAMVKALHAAGIEVILDVVYNHTAEGNHLGPTLAFKGIDNPTYYRLMPEARYYLDYTGTGNSVNVLHPRTLQLIMDSLRYWVLEMHVDGFRFDLAATLARGLYEGDRLSAFFDIIHQDPVLSQVKLIAEPWDIGPGGYQVGNFPILWAEWNGKYRDTVRRYWRGDEAQLAELAYRLSGSSDLYQGDGRRPYASINFLTAHDGFTLRDLVSYDDKRNDANGEGNRDGESNNNSWNCGVEGPTDDPAVNVLRDRQQRNLLATLLLSQGVPMLVAGDERGRTQGGNNNAYCQDNEISWLDWELDGGESDFLRFSKKLIALRKDHPVLHRRSFFQGRSIHGLDVSDIEWYRPDGRQMSDDEWANGTVRCVGLLLNGQNMDERDLRGQPTTDDVLLLLLNADHESIAFTLPSAGGGPTWEAMIDTAQPDDAALPHTAPGEVYTLHGRSLVVLCQPIKRDAPEVHPMSDTLETDGVPATFLPLVEGAHTVVGNVMTIAGLGSAQLGIVRDIKVYLPPSYTEGAARYPVLYMHDGQNLFDQATAFADEWRVDETMEELAGEGTEAIVVGIPNAGRGRLDEYSPFSDPEYGGGRGEDYLAFIVYALKPYIDASFRTLPEREHTGLLGSSLGALISLYGFFHHRDTFGLAAALSPAFWFADRAIFPFIERVEVGADGTAPALGRVYLDVGTAEGEDTVAHTRRMAELLREKGYRDGANLCYVEAPGGQHNEGSWAARLRGVVIYLLASTVAE